MRSTRQLRREVNWLKTMWQPKDTRGVEIEELLKQYEALQLTESEQEEVARKVAGAYAKGTLT